MSWTNERIELLKKLWGDRLSAEQIASELGGVTRNAVIGKVHRLGLSGRAKAPSTVGLRPRNTKAVENKILNAKLRNKTPVTERLPSTAKSHKNRQKAQALAVSDERQTLIEQVQITPAQVRGPVQPLHQGSAFPTAKDSDLTPAELRAIASMYSS